MTGSEAKLKTTSAETCETVDDRYLGPIILICSLALSYLIQTYQLLFQRRDRPML